MARAQASAKSIIAAKSRAKHATVRTKCAHHNYCTHYVAFVPGATEHLNFKHLTLPLSLTACCTPHSKFHQIAQSAVSADLLLACSLANTACAVMNIMTALIFIIHHCLSVACIVSCCCPPLIPPRAHDSCGNLSIPTLMCCINLK